MVEDKEIKQSFKEVMSNLSSILRNSQYITVEKDDEHYVTLEFDDYEIETYSLHLKNNEQITATIPRNNIKEIYASGVCLTIFMK